MNNTHVLIVEDDSSLIRGLKDNFIKREFQVSTAMDGETALALALQQAPDVIILDIMLPKLDGYQVCEAVREAGIQSTIIMLTAKGQEQEIVHGLNLGADDYITKPFSIAELMARVNAFLRRKTETDERVIRFGHCELHLAAKKLFRNGEEVTLTPKEFGLLTLFHRRKGHALTRDVILNTVWNRNLLNTSRSVDRCVNTLRKKIEEDPKNPVFIKSVRDIGYRWELQ